MMTREELDKTIHYYKTLLTKLEAAVKNGPKGTLYYRTYPSGLIEPYLSIKTEGKRMQKHLDTKDLKYLDQSKKKTFASKMIPKIRKALASLEKSQEFMEVNLFQEAVLLGPQFTECADFFLGTEKGRIPNPVFDRLQERQNPVPFGPNCIETEFGVFRSKNEYEPALPIGGRIFYVDFAADLYWKGQIGIVEHHGMLDDPKYRARKLNDLDYMIRHGYYPGQNLLILSDSPDHGYDERQAEKLLRAFCLP